MAKDKMTATWVSHSSISLFLQCPRAYYLQNMYRDPTTRHKIQLASPALSLGSAVHEVIESLSVLPTDQRFSESLITKFDRAWQRVSGKIGGFTDEGIEMHYKQRGEEMLRRVMENPGPLLNKAVKIREDLPQYWLSEEDNIILCGKIDWLEYLSDTDSVHIIDFKTSQKPEDGTSLQLPIYYLLVQNTQKRQVTKASYWYLAFQDELTSKELPDQKEAHDQVFKVAQQIQLARKLERFKCHQGEEGCRACRSLEKIIRGEAEKVGTNERNQDIYILRNDSASEEDESYIL